MKKNSIIFLISFLVIFTFLFFIPLNNLFAETFNVVSGQSIQNAINAAKLNDVIDTINIAPGTYYENLDIDIALNNELYLIGSGPGSTTIDGNATSQVIRISGAGTVYISNLKITNGIGWGAGIGNDAILYLDNCIVSDNNSGSHGGGLDNGTKGITFISNCKIINNFASISGGGIYNDSSGIVTIDHSSIVGNTAGVSNGIDAPKKVIAKYNWWGSSTGPSGGMADPDTGTLANGSGDEVNAMVYFDPWLTSDPFAVSACNTLTEADWVLMDLNINQLLAHYGPTSEGFIKMLYDNILCRVPDGSGLNYWTEQLNINMFSVNQIVEHFIFSDELSEKIEAMSYEEFITFLYKSFLSRTPDTDGYNHWLSYMADGNSKSDTLRAFLNNEEWFNICKLFNVTP